MRKYIITPILITSLLSGISYAKATSADYVVYRDRDYRNLIDSESLIQSLNNTFNIPSYLQDQYGQFSPESSYLQYPDSTAVVTGLVIGSGGLLLVAFAVIAGDSKYSTASSFYVNRMEYHFTLKDTDNRTTPGYCLVHFAYNSSENLLEYERDECYILVLTGWEDAYYVPIPQTEDGRLRTGRTRDNSLQDWLQGATKVVDVGYIPLED